jgi:quinol monooxygenase YgiN
MPISSIGSAGHTTAGDLLQLTAARLQLVALAAVFAFGLGNFAARAEEAAGPAYLVSYIEVLPKREQQAATMLLKHAAGMRKLPGNLGYTPLQRNSPARHFAVVEIWKDAASLDAARASEEAKAFKAALAPLLAAPLDERPHRIMQTDPARTQPVLAAPPPHAIFIVTHVDVIPPKLEEGLAATKGLFAPSSAEPGNVSYNVLQQISRANHMTLFEIWKNGDALDAHESAEFVRLYRQTLLPIAGSLYDQRVYHTLN